jgi:hypothetical protein
VVRKAFLVGEKNAKLISPFGMLCYPGRAIQLWVFLLRAKKRKDCFIQGGRVRVRSVV